MSLLQSFPLCFKVTFALMIFPGEAPWETKHSSTWMMQPQRIYQSSYHWFLDHALYPSLEPGVSWCFVLIWLPNWSSIFPLSTILIFTTRGGFDRLVKTLHHLEVKPKTVGLHDFIFLDNWSSLMHSPWLTLCVIIISSHCSKPFEVDYTLLSPRMRKFIVPKSMSLLCTHSVTPQVPSGCNIFFSFMISFGLVIYFITPSFIARGRVFSSCHVSLLHFTPCCYCVCVRECESIFVSLSLSFSLFVHVHVLLLLSVRLFYACL